MKRGELLFRENSDADIIVHMASIAGVDSVMKQPVLTMQVSLKGTINVLEVAQASGRCRMAS